MLSNTLRLNFSYLKIIHILHPCYYPKIIGHILKKKLKNKCVFIRDITRLITKKMKMKMKNRSHRYDILLLNSRTLTFTVGYDSFLRYDANKTPHTSTAFGGFCWYVSISFLQFSNLCLNTNALQSFL